MRYTFAGRVRYSETGEDKRLTLPAIVNYFQDCSIFHSEDVGMGVGKLEDNHKVWMLLSWQICIEERPVFGEEIKVQTWAYDFKKFYGYRNFRILNQKGETCAYANSDWILLDTETGRPTKAEDGDIEAYQIEDKLAMDYAPRKITVLGETREEGSFIIQRQHLDTNHHVNNAQYITMAMEYLPKDFCIFSMRAEYKKQAHLHDLVTPKISRDENTFFVELLDDKRSPFVVIEFKEKEQNV